MGNFASAKFDVISVNFFFNEPSRHGLRSAGAFERKAKKSLPITIKIKGKNYVRVPSEENKLIRCTEIKVEDYVRPRSGIFTCKTVVNSVNDRFA